LEDGLSKAFIALKKQEQKIIAIKPVYHHRLHTGTTLHVSTVARVIFRKLAWIGGGIHSWIIGEFMKKSMKNIWQRGSNLFIYMTVPFQPKKKGSAGLFLKWWQWHVDM
jgi:hypothetical protein